MNENVNRSTGNPPHRRSGDSARKLTGLSLLTALVVVLQFIATFVKFGPFSITLALIPIVVGAAIYGPKAGAYLGGVFGVVVLLACIFGWDVGGAILWNANPFLTAVLCLAKGALAGWAASRVYSLVAPKSIVGGTVFAAVVSPVVNTGIFCLALFFLYRDILVAWSGGTSLVVYILTVLVGVNFLVEMGINAVVSPAIVRIIKARKVSA